MADAARASSSGSDAARTDAPTVFRLAPMTRDLTVMTWVAMILPFWLLGAAHLSGGAAQTVIGVAVWFTVLIYLGVWVYGRPTRFEIDDQALRIVWPARRRVIPRRIVRDARILTGAELRQQYGFGARIGAGGVWGGFGLLKTKSTTFSLWISRTDRLVVVELDGERPLLVTPEDPEGFVARLRA